MKRMTYNNTAKHNNIYKKEENTYRVEVEKKKISEGDGLKFACPACIVYYMATGASKTRTDKGGLHQRIALFII